MADGKPLAWIGVFDGEPDPEFIWWDEAKARRWISTRPGVVLAPLSIAPTLTDAERALIEKLTWESEHPKMGRSIWVMPQDRETAHGLLERLK